MSEEYKKKFNKDGYILIKGFFDKEIAHEVVSWLRSQDLRSMSKNFMDQEPGVDLALYQNIHKHSGVLGKIAGDRKILDLASELLEGTAYAWSSKINIKESWYGSAEYYHQDFAYWKQRGYQNADMCTALVALEPQDESNAAFKFFPGSHKEGFVKHNQFANINGVSKFMVDRNVLDNCYEKYGLITLEAEPGDALFFHTNIIHGSSHNSSNRSRMISLTQINIRENLPRNVDENTKKFNLSRTQFELQEARKKIEFFEDKYRSQIENSEILFNSPIQDEERV